MAKTTTKPEASAPHAHAFQAEVAKLLQLMVHSVYSDRDVFLRELISNAADALDKLRYEAIARPELLEGDPELRVTITPDQETKTLTIADNGIGMSEQELVENLGTIAKSGTGRPRATCTSSASSGSASIRASSSPVRSTSSRGGPARTRRTCGRRRVREASPSNP